MGGGEWMDGCMNGWTDHGMNKWQREKWQMNSCGWIKNGCMAGHMIFNTHH